MNTTSIKPSQPIDTGRGIISIKHEITLYKHKLVGLYFNDKLVTRFTKKNVLKNGLVTALARKLSTNHDMDILIASKVFKILQVIKNHK